MGRGQLSLLKTQVHCLDNIYIVQQNGEAFSRL